MSDENKESKKEAPKEAPKEAAPTAKEAKLTPEQKRSIEFDKVVADHEKELQLRANDPKTDRDELVRFRDAGRDLSTKKKHYVNGTMKMDAIKARAEKILNPK